MKLPVWPAHLFLFTGNLLRSALGLMLTVPSPAGRSASWRSLQVRNCPGQHPLDAGDLGPLCRRALWWQLTQKGQRRRQGIFCSRGLCEGAALRRATAAGRQAIPSWQLVSEAHCPEFPLGTHPGSTMTLPLASFDVSLSPGQYSGNLRFLNHYQRQLQPSLQNVDLGNSSNVSNCALF